MKLASIIALSATLLVSTANAQKVVYDDNVEKREVSAFHAIETSSGIEVILTKGDKEELAVSANHKDYLPEVRTIVQNGVLKISRTDDWKIWRQWKNWRIKVYVSYRDLESLKANSGASIHGSDIALQKLSVRLNSGATITLSGTVQSLDVDGSSGAQFHGYDLSTPNCKAEASSGAGVQITVSKEISARANSGGYVRYRGEGLIRDINVNSGGSVKRQG
ncbi:MAG: DUF2807 domain-containing protein [Chitinophagaceae bacterium]|nr:DUF2807 domain-containing protein [Chitinophagaceae bacterium]